MSEINSDNHPAAVEAVRDIIYLYYDLIVSYGGFGHNLERGEFDPFFFVDCWVKEPKGYTFGLDVKLLQQGSAVALLCELSDFWDDHEESPVGSSLGVQLQQLLSTGRLGHLPLTEEAITCGLHTEDSFRGKLPQIYQSYVSGFFKELVASA